MAVLSDLTAAVPLTCERCDSTHEMAMRVQPTGRRPGGDVEVRLVLTGDARAWAHLFLAAHHGPFVVSA